MKYNLFSKKIFIVLILLFVFLGYQKFKQFRLQKQIQIEKNKLLSELSVLENKNKDFKEAIKFLDSENFKEISAKQQLNMQKDGEFAYSFTEIKNQVLENPTTQAQTSNFTKWINYFLNKNQ